MIDYRDEHKILIINYIHGTLANFIIIYVYLAQPRRPLNVGYSWPGVFLLGASGRTGRFFTQLLFHNPYSFKSINKLF